VLANSNNPWEWETFSLINFEKDQCAIRAYNKRYLSVELNQKLEINATREKRSTWETFTIVELGHDTVAFKAVNGKYISVDKKTLQLYAVSLAIGENEKFALIPE